MPNPNLDSKADFDNNHRQALIDPDTNHKYSNFKDPNVNGGNPVNIFLNYHKSTAFYRGKEAIAKFLVKHFTLLPSHGIMIFNGGYGWLGEWLETRAGCECVSVDSSSYIQATKNLSGDDELIAAIQAGGFDETSGFGLEIFNKFTDPNPQSNLTGGVADEDLSTPQSRQNVIDLLTNTIDYAITDEGWQYLTAQDKTNALNFFDNLGTSAVVVHLIHGQLFDRDELPLVTAKEFST